MTFDNSVMDSIINAGVQADLWVLGVQNSWKPGWSLLLSTIGIYFMDTYKNYDQFAVFVSKYS